MTSHWMDNSPGSSKKSWLKYHGSALQVVDKDEKVKATAAQWNGINPTLGWIGFCDTVVNLRSSVQDVSWDGWNPPRGLIEDAKSIYSGDKRGLNTLSVYILGLTCLWQESEYGCLGGMGGGAG